MKPAVLTSLAFAAAAIADPLRTCLSPRQAYTIVNQFIGILDGQGYDGQSANETAQALIADDFIEISDSILSLQQRPLGGLAAASKAQWAAGVLAHPNANLTTNDIIVGCNKIVWYWTFPDVGTGEYQVKGFNLFEINTEYQICRLYLEFNSIAWGLDTHEGPLCPPNSTNTTRKM